MGIYTKLVKSTLGFEEKGKNCFHGVYKGYDVTINVTNLFVVNLNFKANDKIKFEAARIFRETDTQALTKVGTVTLGIQAFVNGFTAKSALNKIVKKLDATIEWLNNNGAKCADECTNCECQDNLSTIKMNDVYVTVCEECKNKLVEYAEKQNEEFDNQPNNYGKGFLGALLGAVIGAVAWFILALIGYMSALTAVLGVYLGNLFYVKFGGKPTKVKTLICALVTLVVFIFICLYTYSAGAQGIMLENNITDMKPFEYIYSIPEYKSAFISDMIMNVVFTLIGVVAISIDSLKRDKNKKVSIK